MTTSEIIHTNHDCYITKHNTVLVRLISLVLKCDKNYVRKFIISTGALYNSAIRACIYLSVQIDSPWTITRPKLQEQKAMTTATKRPLSCNYTITVGTTSKQTRGKRVDPIWQTIKKNLYSFSFISGGTGIKAHA